MRVNWEKTNPTEMIVMVGLPLSGKSTVVNKMKKSPISDHFTIICPDDVRVALHGSLFNPAAEEFVWAITHTMVKSLLIRGQSVIIDSTNKSKWERQQWQRIANEHGVPLRIIHVSTTDTECIRRAKESNRENMIPVIERMAEKFEPLEEDERVRSTTL